MRELLQAEPLDAARAFTLLTLLLVPIGDWTLRAPILLLAGAGLLLPALRASAAVWALLACATGLPSPARNASAPARATSLS